MKTIITAISKEIDEQSEVFYQSSVTIARFRLIPAKDMNTEQVEQFQEANENYKKSDKKITALLRILNRAKELDID
jgi:hypothetical protein